MRVLILEDEQLAAQQTQKLLNKLAPESEIVGILSSIEEAQDWFADNEFPDLVLSDIELLDGLSFEIFKEIQGGFPIIFTTAYDQYALTAFQTNGIAYLLKPIKEKELAQSLDKFKATFISQKSKSDTSDTPQAQIPSLESIHQLLHALKNQTRQTKSKSRFMVKIGQKIRAIPTTQIAYFYSKDKITFLVTKENEKYPVDYSLDDLLSMLDEDDFFKVNRQFIIHIEATREIRPYFKGRLKVYLDPHIEDDIVVSANTTPAFKEWLDK